MIAREEDLISRMRARSSVRWTLALGMPLLATLLQYLGYAAGIQGIYFILYFPAVLICCVGAGFRPGMFSALFSIFLTDYFFLPPMFQFIFTGTEGVKVLLFSVELLLMAAGTSWILEKYRARAASHFVLQMQSLLDRMGEGFLNLDNELRYEYVNPAAEAIIRTSGQSVIGKSIFDVFPAARDTEFGKQLQICLKDKKNSVTESYYPPWDAWFINYIYYTQRGGIAVFLRNITESKRSQILLKQQAEKLTEVNSKLTKTIEELNRSNSELAQFATIASHDLKEPLRTMTNYAQLLAKEFPSSSDRYNKFLNYIISGSKKMNFLISDILNYSQVGVSQMTTELVDLNFVLEEVKANLTVLISETNAEIRATELPTVNCNRDLMIHVMQNLISNALKFRKQGSDPKVEISEERVSDGHVICVRDEGIGIEISQQEKIFQIFRRIHSASDYPGSGIGLAICKRAVERHGGRIWVESSPGNGSKFAFHLPEKPGATTFELSQAK